MLGDLALRDVDRDLGEDLDRDLRGDLDRDLREDLDLDLRSVEGLDVKDWRRIHQILRKVLKQLIYRKLTYVLIEPEPPTWP